MTSKRYKKCPNCAKRGGYRVYVREVDESRDTDRLLWRCRYCQHQFWTDADGQVGEDEGE